MSLYFLPVVLILLNVIVTFGKSIYEGGTRQSNNNMKMKCIWCNYGLGVVIRKGEEAKALKAVGKENTHIHTHTHTLLAGVYHTGERDITIKGKFGKL